VSAETAVVLPLLVAVTIGLVWLVGVAVTQIRVVDAARETARAAARDESAATAVQLGRRVAPTGSRIDLQRSEGTVRVHVVAEVRGPGGIFAFLPALEVDGRAVAASERR
jgi:Flp pilus assembly protein TadG